MGDHEGLTNRVGHGTVWAWGDALARWRVSLAHCIPLQPVVVGTLAHRRDSAGRRVLALVGPRYAAHVLAPAACPPAVPVVPLAAFPQRGPPALLWGWRLGTPPSQFSRGLALAHRAHRRPPWRFAPKTWGLPRQADAWARATYLSLTHGDITTVPASAVVLR